MDASVLLAATWPPAETARAGGFLVRRGLGGGRRVSSGLLEAPDWCVAEAEDAMARWGQPPCFQIWPGQERLDADLAGRGYAIRDPSVVLEAPADALALAGCDERTIYCEAPLASMEEIWRNAGMGRPQRAIMDRVTGPKTWILGRLGDRPAGAAFAAASGPAAVLHALEVRPAARRAGLGARMTRAAAAWAVRNGADRLLLAVRSGNAAALGLHAALGLSETCRYHYRERP